MEVQVDDEHRPVEASGARLGDRHGDVVDRAEALAPVAEGVVEAAPEVERGAPPFQSEADGEDRPPRHRPLRGEHAVGKGIGEVEAEDPGERPRPRQRLQVLLVVHPAELAVGGRLRRVDPPRVGEAGAQEEGEDALAAQRVGRRRRQLQPVGAAVDEVDPPPPEPERPRRPAEGTDEGACARRGRRRFAGGRRRLAGRPEPHPGRPPAAGLGGRVAEGRHPRVAGEEGAHHLALGADPLAVDDAQMGEAGRGGGVQIGEDEVAHLARREAVEVQDVADRQLDRSLGIEPVVALVVLVAHGGPWAPLGPEDGRPAASWAMEWEGGPEGAARRDPERSPSPGDAT